MRDINPKIGIPKDQRIFVNRSLNFGNIKLIGFDMDHTIAPYNRETFEALAFRETLKKFIEAGYPEQLSTLAFKPDFVIRGLLVDKVRGNVLKVDGHKYVKDAYHGYKRLTKEERHALYNKQSIKAHRFLSVDTFFALSEVQLFVEIVDYMDRHPGQIDKTYEAVYQDLREFIDLSHADGSIKKEVLSNPEKYIIKDRYLPTALLRQLDAGKSLFLLTNSAYTYTDHIMSFVLNDAHEDFKSWKDYWDIIIVGSGKPGFFTGSQPFFEMVEGTEYLRQHHGQLNPGSTFFGGNAKLFEKLTGYRGDEILYVGDHIYGDIIQSKDSLNWRTMLIVEELVEELPKLEKLQPLLDNIYASLNEREVLDEKLQKLRSKIAANKRQEKIAIGKHEDKRAATVAAENEKVVEKFNELKATLDKLEEDVKAQIEERGRKVHPVWGELMKVGLERSRFAHQVGSYACIYTSRASNLRFYSPYKRFISFHEVLPHEE